MIPVQSDMSCSMQTSAFPMIPSICHCGSSFVNDMELWLPLSRRGHFFRDSFFENARRHFDAAVREALCKWGDMANFSSSASLIDNLSRYRQLRTNNRLEDSLATTYVSDNNTHKIVMDIHEFKDGDVKVRVLGEKEVFVEGKGHGLSSSQSFSRRFILPESVDMTAVTSVLSSDGFLTIEAPVMRSKVVESSTSVANTQKTVESYTEQSCDVSRKTLAEGNKVFYCKGCNKKIGPWLNERASAMTRQEGMKIPIKIDAMLTQDSAPSAIPISMIASDTWTNNPKVKDIKIELEKEQTKGNEMTNRELCDATNNSVTKTLANSMNMTPTATQITSYNVPISSYFSTFPITRRGLFFSDSIFEDMRKEFEVAVQEVLSKWGDRSSVMDNLTRYRNLRSLDLREENQATKVIDGETSHKVVLDVQDFMNGGDITVKAINDRELVIEGQVNEQNSCSKSQKKFSKRFVFPRDIQLDAMSSIMSSDGVLTVTAPVKPPTLQLRECMIPMTIEEVGDKDKEKKNATHIICEALDERAKKNACDLHQDSSVSTLKKESRSALATQKNSSSREHIIPVATEGEHSSSSDNYFVCEAKVRSEIKDKQTSSNHSQPELSSLESKTAEASPSPKITSNAKRNETTAVLEQAERREFPLEGATSLVAEDYSNSLQLGKCLVSSGSKYLPITRRGLFFNDSFFEEYRKDFQNAVTQVLVKFRQNFNESELMNTYRNFRLRNLQVENQALKVHEDQNSFKVVLDVKDFTDGDITVYVDGEELVIEGRAERTEAKSSDTLTFSHRFLLPEVTDLSAISSAISSDGVLTVNSPKNGASSGNTIRKMSSSAESQHESHQAGNHLWETKNVSESSQHSKGFSSHTSSSSSQSRQQHSSQF